MRIPLIAGVVLGVVVTLWSLLIVAAGWHVNPAMIWTFSLVVLIEILVLVWALRKTAAEGRTYGAQVWAGLVASIVGGVLIFAGSLLITTVLYPEYFDEIRAMGAEVARQAGQSEAQVQAILETPTQTPVEGALAGLVGTVATGLLASLIIAAFLRRRDVRRIDVTAGA
jgi:hypothetical protein